jgi:hypothetical protein
MGHGHSRAILSTSAILGPLLGHLPKEAHSRVQG